MRSLITLLMILAVVTLAGLAQAQPLSARQTSAPSASVAALFLDPVSRTTSPQVVETCTTARSCVVLGAVLTVVGVGVVGVGVSFLTRLDADNAESDIVAIPTVFLGGTLVVTGLVSTGAGLHLLRRSRRLKRMNLNIGWRGAPQAHLHVRL